MKRPTAAERAQACPGLQLFLTRDGMMHFVVEGRLDVLRRTDDLDKLRLVAWGPDPGGEIQSTVRTFARAKLRRLIRASGVRQCERCGCTDDDCRGCVERTGKPCHWVGPLLCSACADPSEEGRTDA